jgi:hypothetical protein
MNFIFNDNVRILCLSCNVKKVVKLVSFRHNTFKRSVKFYKQFKGIKVIVNCIYKNNPWFNGIINFTWLTLIMNNSNKKDRNKRHSSPFINVVKGAFFVVRVTLVPVSYLSAPYAVHSYIYRQSTYIVYLSVLSIINVFFLSHLIHRIQYITVVQSIFNCI